MSSETSSSNTSVLSTKEFLIISGDMRVVEIVPVRVVEIVPAAVVEIVPVRVVEIVPLFGKAVNGNTSTNNVDESTDLGIFIDVS